MLQLYFTFTPTSSARAPRSLHINTHLIWIQLTHLIHTHRDPHPKVTVPPRLPKCFGTALLIVRPPLPTRTLSFCSRPLLPGCSRSQVSMVTLLQNVSVLFGPFVLSDRLVIRTCSPADMQPATDPAASVLRVCSFYLKANVVTL